MSTASNSLLPTTTRWILWLIAAFLVAASVGAAGLQGAPPAASTQEARQEAADTLDRHPPSLATAERRAARQVALPVWTATRRVVTRVRRAPDSLGREGQDVPSEYFPGAARARSLDGPIFLEMPGAHGFGFGLSAPLGWSSTASDSSDAGAGSSSPP